VIIFCDDFAEAGGKLLLCLPMQTNTPKKCGETLPANGRKQKPNVKFRFYE
jgi:hypothetical protein